MLDSDLAQLYGVQTKVFNQAVKRNLERFPLDFMFQLSFPEIEMYLIPRSHFVTLESGKNIKYKPFAFTEQGIAMLSSVLRSQRAIQINIAIMRAFVKLRYAMLSHQGISRRVEKLEGKINIIETDIRLLVQDVGDLKKGPQRRSPIDPEVV